MKLNASGLHKVFEGANHVRVLNGIDLQTQSGDALAITGPSGSGKSTLLHILGVLDEPTDGQLRYDDQDPFALSAKEQARFRNTNLGFVFQEHYLLPQFTVIENVLIPSIPRGAISKETRRYAEGLLDRVGLADRTDHRPAELSGGERQRVAIARALLNRPGIILCDEPTGNLDRTTAGEIADLLFELHDAENNILIIVTHSLELADRCQTRFELNQGLLEGERPS